MKAFLLILITTCISFTLGSSYWGIVLNPVNAGEELAENDDSDSTWEEGYEHADQYEGRGRVEEKEDNVLIIGVETIPRPKHLDHAQSVDEPEDVPKDMACGEFQEDHPSFNFVVGKSGNEMKRKPPFCHYAPEHAKKHANDSESHANESPPVSMARRAALANYRLIVKKDDAAQAVHRPPAIPPSPSLKPRIPCTSPAFQVAHQQQWMEVPRLCLEMMHETADPGIKGNNKRSAPIAEPRLPPPDHVGQPKGHNTINLKPPTRSTVTTISISRSNSMAAPVYTVVLGEYNGSCLARSSVLGRQAMLLINLCWRSLGWISPELPKLLPKPSPSAAHLHNCVALYHALREKDGGGGGAVRLFLHRFPRTILPDLDALQNGPRLEASLQAMREAIIAHDYGVQNHVKNGLKIGGKVDWEMVLGLFRKRLETVVKAVQGEYEMEVYIVDSRIIE